MTVWETTGYVKAGRLHVRNRAATEAAFKTWRDGEVVVRIERAHATRSADANALYWAGFIRPLVEHTGYTPSEMHAYLKRKFLPGQHLMIQNTKGEVVDESDSEPTTRTLNRIEFGEYLREIQVWAADELGVTLGSVRDEAG